MPVSRPARRIAAVAGDPGGARAIAPVLLALQKADDSRLRTYSYHEATAIFQSEGLEVHSLENSASVTAARSLLASEGAEVLLTATSMNGVDWEPRFIQAAHELRLPSLAVLDFWSNYRPRFSTDGTELDALPTRIAVMDTFAHDQMVAEGFPPERLVVTGQPALDHLIARSRTAPDRPGKPRSLRRVGFLSQPLSELYDRTGTFDETTVLEFTLRLLEQVSDEVGPIELHLRPHPRESREKFRRFKSSSVAIRLNDSSDRFAFLESMDCVVGINTILLLEAALMGVPALSWQPGIEPRHDAFAANRQGLTLSAYSEEAGRKLLRELLIGGEILLPWHERRGELSHRETATLEVTRTLHTLLKV
jgi:hypothetical protein